MPKKYRVKVYTVQISYCHISHNRWYHLKKGEFFNCVLVSKENESGVITANFCQVSKNDDDGFMVPTTILTIRPDDCVVVSEEMVDVSSALWSFIYEFSNYSNERRKTA